jgi:NAD(P)-dependent dehydrogenase (short-subunit alcohol dehydrogenase family)
MSGRLEGQVAIITGATSGIGEGTAKRFVEEGARVVIAGRSEKQGEAIAGRLGPGAVFCRTDVTRESDIVAMIQCAKENFGRLDCLFNNAGSSTSSFGVEGINEESFIYDMKLLVGSVVLGVKHALPLMRAQGSGSVINNASIAGLGSGYGPLVYSGAKAAVVQITKSLAMELAKDNIRVNAISPGVIETPIFGRVLGMGEKRTQETLHEVGSWLGTFAHQGRPGTPRDIGDATVFLASPESSYITGHNLVVDGGMTIGLTWEEVGRRLGKLQTMAGH